MGPSNTGPTDGRTLQYVDLTIDDKLELIDAVVGKLEEQVDEFTRQDEHFVVEVADRLNSLANHFRPTPSSDLVYRYPHVPDEVLVDAPGVHEGAPFPIFTGGPPITGRVLAGEVEEGLDEEEQ